MALVRTCRICRLEKVIRDRELMLCDDCVEKVIANNKALKKENKEDKKNGIIRFG